MGENGRKIDFQGRGVLEALYNHVIAIKLNQSNKKTLFQHYYCTSVCGVVHFVLIYKHLKNLSYKLT